ncbi:unnamed protein product [Protopolystoma xenopodis]|uniref:Uncharacterized protein n=1 Tax=Protopolystoma xenopodis TaxID=117903 RepID=A0A3S5AZQ4_9PLAT|nr:unnamed protein product [Protopolystoma xenopodis]
MKRVTVPQRHKRKCPLNSVAIMSISIGEVGLASLGPQLLATDCLRLQVPLVGCGPLSLRAPVLRPAALSGKIKSLFSHGNCVDHPPDTVRFCLFFVGPARRTPSHTSRDGERLARESTKAEGRRRLAEEDRDVTTTSQNGVRPTRPALDRAQDSSRQSSDGICLALIHSASQVFLARPVHKIGRRWNEQSRSPSQSPKCPVRSSDEIKPQPTKTRKTYMHRCPHNSCRGDWRVTNGKTTTTPWLMGLGLCTEAVRVCNRPPEKPHYCRQDTGQHRLFVRHIAGPIIQGLGRIFPFHATNGMCTLARSCPPALVAQELSSEPGKWEFGRFTVYSHCDEKKRPSFCRVPEEGIKLIKPPLPPQLPPRPVFGVYVGGWGHSLDGTKEMPAPMMEVHLHLRRKVHESTYGRPLPQWGYGGTVALMTSRWPRFWEPKPALVGATASREGKTLAKLTLCEDIHTGNDGSAEGSNGPVDQLYVGN